MSEARMLPDDDPSRALTVAQAEADSGLPHVALVGDVYTILVTGEQTGGRYALIDMFVPPRGGPPPHRHDFEEMFHVLEGEVEVLFRGARSAARAGAEIQERVPPAAVTCAMGASGGLSAGGC